MQQDGYYSVPRTVAQSLRIWARNLLPILLLGIVFYAPLILYTVHDLREVRAGELTSLDGWWVALMALLAYAADQLLAAPIVYGVVQDLNGTRAGVAACIAQGVKRFIPVFFTVFLLYWCVFFGAYPFVIPGLVLATGLYVAVPAAVCERPGIMGTLTRSFGLTEGNRLRIFALLVGFWGSRIFIKLVLLDLLSADLQLLLVSSLLVDFLYSTVGAVLQGVTYSRLRQLRDGISTADLAKIFE
jgi:hypothetical protein